MNDSLNHTDHLRAHIVAFINADSWQDSERYVTEHAELLLSAEIDPIFDDLLH